MGWVLNATPRQLFSRERPGTHCIGGWVWKISLPQRFDPRTVQPAASRYTDSAISAHTVFITVFKMLKYIMYDFEFNGFLWWSRQLLLVVTAGVFGR
jgi:hypothetical protein